MRVLVLAEYYPRPGDPVLGIWAHRQTLAVRAAGVDARVRVLHRPLPPLAALARRDRTAIVAGLRRPRATRLDGLSVDYLSYVSPPRPLSYGSWGAWAAPVLRRALSTDEPFDLIHAHNAIPAGDAARRAAPSTPLVVSVHGGDVHGGHGGHRAIAATFAHARVVLANSAGTAARCAARGARTVRVVHLGTDPLAPAAAPRPEPDPPVLVSVGNLIARKRQGDVIEALGRLRDRHPQLRYVVVGDGPERERLTALARRLGVADRVSFRGRLPHDQAVAAARAGTLFVMPSVAEAFGVAYVEAMAAGVPAVAAAGEDGPAEIAAAGGGIELVPPRDPGALATVLDRLLGDPARRAALGAQARANVEANFTWDACARATVSAYAEALAA